MITKQTDTVRHISSNIMTTLNDGVITISNMHPNLIRHTNYKNATD